MKSIIHSAKAHRFQHSLQAHQALFIRRALTAPELGNQPAQVINPSLLKDYANSKHTTIIYGNCDFYES